MGNNVWGTRETANLEKVSTTKSGIVPNKIIGKFGRTLVVSPSLLVYIVTPRWVPAIDVSITQDLREHLEAQKCIVKYEFDTYVGGHLIVGSKYDVRTNFGFTEDRIEAARNSLSPTQENLIRNGQNLVSDLTVSDLSLL